MTSYESRQKSDTIFLIPCFNPSTCDLSRTLNSIKLQTIQADVLIIDDGSTEPLQPAFNGLSIVVLRHSPNQGISRALNVGMRWLLERDYKYIARIDCGDTCKPNRLALQRDYMSNNPTIELLGGSADILDSWGNHLFFEGGYGSSSELTAKLYDNSCFKHSTFLFRKSSIADFGIYSNAYPSAEDYEMLRRIDRRRALACVPEVLIDYFTDPAGISARRRRQQVVSRLRIQLAYFNIFSIRAYLGIIRTLLTLIIPVRLWKIFSQIYWKRRLLRKINLR